MSYKCCRFFMCSFKRRLGEIKSLIISENFGLSIVLFSFLVLIISLFVFLIFGNWDFSTVLSEEKIAQFGDFVGGVIGTLLAFAASVLYYIALKEQQKDVKTNQLALEKQIDEFANQVEELQLSRKVYEEQQKTLHIQQFESNFYSYFNIYLKVKNGLETDKERNYFKLILNYLSNSSNYKELNLLSIDKCYEQVKNNYLNIFISNRKDYDYYFRCFYRLLSIVVCSFQDPKEQMKYIKIIRSQLTDYELLVLYYNIHSKYAGNSKDLIYRFNVLKHLQSLDKIELKNRYQLTIQDQTKIAEFSSFLSEKLVPYVNSICDFIEMGELQYEYQPLQCYLELSSLETQIKISVLIKDTSKIPDCFETIVEDLIYDILFITTNNIVSNPIEKKESKDKATGYLVEDYCVEIGKLKKIIFDLDENDTK